jgi:hypothetical protein
LKRHVRDSAEFVASRAAGRLNGDPVGDGDDVSGQIVRIGAVRQVSVGNRSLKSLSQANFESTPSLGHLAANAIRLVSAGQSRLHQKAAARVSRAGGQLDGLAPQPLDDGPRRRLPQRFGDMGGRPVDISIDGFAKQGFLVAEGGVKARAVDAHRFG